MNSNLSDVAARLPLASACLPISIGILAVLTDLERIGAFERILLTLAPVSLGTGLCLLLAGVGIVFRLGQECTQAKIVGVLLGALILIPVIPGAFEMNFGLETPWRNPIFAFDFLIIGIAIGSKREVKAHPGVDILPLWGIIVFSSLLANLIYLLLEAPLPDTRFFVAHFPLGTSVGMGALAAAMVLNGGNAHPLIRGGRVFPLILVFSILWINLISIGQIFWQILTWS